MDTRNISRQTFINTINKFEEKYPDIISNINDKIKQASENVQFMVRIDDNDVDVVGIGKMIQQYYTYRGYDVFVNEGDKTYGVRPYIKIDWSFESLEQPYDD